MTDDDATAGDGDGHAVENGRDERAAARVREDHAEFLDAVAAAARVTAKTWRREEEWGEEGKRETADSRHTDELRASAASSEDVVGPFERVLRETGTLSAATEVLADAVDAAGGTLRAEPVPDTPYVAVTSRGLVLRATTDVGRVVVTIAPFAVERDPVRYRLRDVEPDDLVFVDVHDASR